MLGGAFAIHCETAPGQKPVPRERRTESRAVLRFKTGAHAWAMSGELCMFWFALRTEGARKGGCARLVFEL